MVISDHINWSGYNPLIGMNNDSYGPRFHDMSDGYHKFYRNQLKDIAKKIINLFLRVFIVCILVQILKPQLRYML